MKQKKCSTLKIIQSPIVKIILGGLFCVLLPVLVNKLVFDILFQKLGFDENLNRSIRVFISTVILMPFFYYLLFRKLEKRKITEFRLTQKGLPVIFGFISSTAIIGISFILLFLTGFINIQAIQFPSYIIVNLIMIMGFVITEEVFFRGVFYRIIEESWGTIIALASSALVFSLMHLGNENAGVMSFISVITGGAVLGILYTYTKNLLVPITFHFGWNLTQVLLGFGLSGGDEFSALNIFKLEISGSEIISGGNRGIENSIIAIILLIIVFILLYLKCSLSKKLTLFKKTKSVK